MRIGANIPFHVAKAYGVQPPTAAPSMRPVMDAAPIAASAPAAAVAPNSNIRGLVAGAVREAVDFDAASTPAAPAGPVLQLYTRAADRIEAATGIQLGRALDLKG